MAKLTLTPQQQAVVENRGGSLLVSAAAGSGKTKVLVDRLFRYITEDHCNVDDFLIITYTKAAAAELRSKIASELSKRMAKQSLGNLRKFDSAASIAEYYMETMRHYRTECVMLILLDNRGHLLGERMISSGTVNASLISPREIFIQALKF